jgi:predicted DNA-binding transcriptional regulator AlpA
MRKPAQQNTEFDPKPGALASSILADLEARTNVLTVEVAEILRISEGANVELTKALKPALTVAEVAELTGYSRQTVTRMFEDEPGVLVIRRPETRNKRSYRSIRIPRSVYERVVRRFAN